MVEAQKQDSKPKAVTNRIKSGGLFNCCAETVRHHRAGNKLGEVLLCKSGDITHKMRWGREGWEWVYRRHG